MAGCHTLFEGLCNLYRLVSYPNGWIHNNVWLAMATRQVLSTAYPIQFFDHVESILSSLRRCTVGNRFCIVSDVV